VSAWGQGGNGTVGACPAWHGAIVRGWVAYEASTRSPPSRPPPASRDAPVPHLPQRKFLGAYVMGGVLRREERERKRERERGDSKCERLRSAGNLSASKIARPTTTAPTSRGPTPWPPHRGGGPREPLD
ncbi:hypothetical protein B296_00024622, partial [Ensete ventricosum]